MRARSFLILSAITLAVSAAAAVVVGRQENPRSAVATAGPVLPGLEDRLGDVGAVVLRGGGETLTIHRIEGGWGVKERNDYPVSPDKVRDLVRSMVELEKAEAKTTQPDRYARLGVEDVTAPAAKSKEVVLETSAGTPVAALIVGSPGGGVGAEGATYVRIKDDAQAWLAKGSITVSVEPQDWVERRLIEIPMADIREGRIKHPDGPAVVVVREEGGAAAFRLAELPRGAKPKSPGEAETVVQPLSDIPLEEIVPAEGQSFPADKALRVTVLRIDGSTVGFDVVEREGSRWLRFVDGAAPASVPAAGRGMVFQVPTWKISPLERKLAELIESPGS